MNYKTCYQNRFILKYIKNIKNIKILNILKRCILYYESFQKDLHSPSSSLQEAMESVKNLDKICPYHGRLNLLSEKRRVMSKLTKDKDIALELPILIILKYQAQKSLIFLTLSKDSRFYSSTIN